MSSVTPEQFLNGGAPPRIGGSEAEYDVQVPGETSENTGDYSLLSRANVAKAKLGGYSYDDSTYWLPNGGNLHPDVNRVEYSSGEGDTAVSLAAGNLAGIPIMQSLTATRPGARAFRHSGTMIDKRFRTLGYHQNLTIPRKAAVQELAGLWDAYQATRIWAWSGMVGASGMELSQKARGMGTPTSFFMGARTTEGDKPMGWIKVGDADVYARYDENYRSPWARVEGRVVDGGFSRWAAFMSEAVGSLMLRFAEHRGLFGTNDPLITLPLANPVTTLHQVSADLTLAKTYETAAGKLVTAIDVQEAIAQYGDILRQNIALPPDEHLAVDMLYDICDRLRRVDIPNGDVSAILSRVDFAARLRYLLKFFSMGQIKSSNKVAVDRSLTWDRIYPEGPGLSYWNSVYAKGKAPDPIGSGQIAHHTNSPVATNRSAIRGHAVSDPKIRSSKPDISWPVISLNGRRVLMEPYDNDISVLGS